MSTMILNLSGDDYQGAPVIGITLDATPQAQVACTAVHGIGVQAYSVSVTPGAHTLTVQLLNDLYGGDSAHDRNVYVESILIDGVDQKLSAALFGSTPQTLNITVPAPVPVASDTAAVLAAIADLKAAVAAEADALAASGAGVKADRGAGLAGLAAQIAAIPSAGGTTTTTAAPTTPLNTTFHQGWATLTASTADSIGAALAVAAKGFVLLLQPGTYKQVFNVPSGLDGWTIKSVSGVPGDVVITGQGGLSEAANQTATSGTPDRLSFGKGVIHCSSPGTIQGITVTGGGPTDDEPSDLQAGVYWDCSGGTGAVRDCMIIKNENGIASNTTSAAMRYVVDNCYFSGNGADEHSHDTYFNSADLLSSLAVINSIFTGSNRGNDVKARVSTVAVSGSWFGTPNANRVIDCADGSTLTLAGNTFVGNDGGQNFFANGDESANKGPGNTAMSGNKVYVGNRTQDFLNAGTLFGQGNQVFFSGAQSNLINSKGTGLGDMPANNPTPGQFTPLPAAPAWPLIPA